MEDLEQQLIKATEAGHRFKLIVTDGVFSMDGLVAPLDKIQDSFLLSTDQYETNHGVIKYAPENSIVKPGDYIVFSKDSEYEFNIDGELLYRMKLNDVCLTLNKES